jgi:hypothetical protein
MLKFYSNRELSERLNIPLSRWKRWSREFLPPDPLGGLQSGYARQYNIRDAFRVYLAGYLVSGVGLSIPEARKVLEDMNGWLRQHVIEPGSKATQEMQRQGEDSPWIELIILPIRTHRPPAFTYRIRSIVERKALETEHHKQLWQETFAEQIIKPADPASTGCYPACPRRVALSHVAQHFFRRLSLE